ncbi:unnamed protein product, partial [Natator depressus]
ISPNEIERFSDFPLSNKTLKGLQEAQYRMVTEIQRQTIGLSLQGKDVLGAAKTGSGKTLAFIIPLVVCLQTLCTYFCNVTPSSQVPGRSPSLPGAQWPGPSISKISGVYNEVVSLLKLQKDEQNRVDIYCVLEKVLQQDTQGLERRLLEKIITLASNHMTETQEARNELKVAASNTLVTLARCYFNDVMYELMYRLELPEEFIFITLGNLSSAY